MKLEESATQHRVSLDVTPMIDVVFLLIIFFAVTTSFIDPADLDLLRRQFSALVISGERLQQNLHDERSKNTALSRDLGASRDSLAALQTQHSQTSAALSQANDRLASLDSLAKQKTTLEEELARLAAELNIVREREQASVIRLGELQVNETRLQEQLAALQADASEQNRQLLSLQAQLQNKENDSAAQRAEIASLKNAAAAAQNREKQLAGDLVAARDQQAVTASELAAAQNNLQALQLSFDQLDDALLQEREQHRAALASVNADLLSERKSSEQLAETIAQLEKEREQKLAELALFEQQIQQQLAELAAAKADSSDNAAQLLALQEQLKATQSERDDLAGALAALQAQKEAQTMLALSLRGQLQQSKAQAEDALAQAQQRDEELAQLEQALAREREYNRSVLFNLQSELVAAQDKEQALAQDISALESRLATALAAVAKARQEAAASTAALGKLAGEKQQLQQQIEGLVQDRLTLATDLAARKKEIEQLRAERERLQALLDQDQLRNVRASAVEQDLGKSLDRMVRDKSLSIERQEAKLVVNLSNQVLFGSGEAELKPAGLEILRRMGELLNTELVDFNVQVLGHTDNIPVRGRFGNNWALSSARAVNVVSFLEEEVGVEGARLSAIGHGKFQPIAPNDTPDQRARNRRIELILTPRSGQ